MSIISRLGKTSPYNGVHDGVYIITQTVRAQSEKNDVSARMK